MDPIFTLFLIVVALVIFGLLINKRLTQISEKAKPTDELLEYLKSTNLRLNEQNRSFNERLDNAARVISEVQKNIGEMSEIGRGMKDLQEFLRSPKVRGNVGEHILKELLSQILPKQSFHLQYAFRSGEKVDAAIKTSAGIISIDSKFPMENFRRMTSAKNDEEKKVYEKMFEKEVKNHIDSISKKYILTEEGTIDYALMYVPSEAVYYEVVNNHLLFEYAGDKRVLPVSPTTFYAYMRAILMSFEGQKIEVEAREILAALKAVQKDYVKVEDNLGILQKHLNNAYNMMSSVVTSFGQLGQKITATRSLREGKVENSQKLEG
jgi:DNA recombination protein RmuC